MMPRPGRSCSPRPSLARDAWPPFPKTRDCHGVCLPRAGDAEMGARVFLDGTPRSNFIQPLGCCGGSRPAWGHGGRALLSHSLSSEPGHLEASTKNAMIRRAVPGCYPRGEPGNDEAFSPPPRGPRAAAPPFHCRPRPRLHHFPDNRHSAR